MQLRKETSLPLKNCREALMETDWDYDAAKSHLKKEAKRLGLQKMAKLASRATTEGLVGTAIGDNKIAVVVVNCETEPVAKTAEFNQLVQNVSKLLLAQPPSNYSDARILEIPGVHDELAAAIGLIRENIQVKKGLVVEGDNLGVYVRTSSSSQYPNNGTYVAVTNLDGGNSELASNLAKHCVLELPDKTGKVPKVKLSENDVGNDEYRLYYQLLNGGREVVFNALEAQNAKLKFWQRFNVAG